MKKKKQPFDNLLAGELLKNFRHDKNNLKLRNRIVRMALPLIDAAISKKQSQFPSVSKNRDDIKQECALKVILAIPKYNAKRGDPFGFMWTVISNTCLTHIERLNRKNYSISSDEVIRREAEESGTNVFKTPETQHILCTIVKDLNIAMSESSFRVPTRSLHRKACLRIQEAIFSGELFSNRNLVMSRLRELGLNKKEILYYCQYSIVVVRDKLLQARENANAITHSEASPAFSSKPNIGVA